MISGLSDRYRVLSTVGTGGVGVVYKAIDTSLSRPVAIKAIRPQHLNGQSARRLRDEALAAASLDHPYICKVYELIETPHETLIVMEFVEGETLAAKLDRGVPPLDATLLMGSEIAEGLAAAHARGVVHRDIKPSNLMITPHGHVKILDFGLAHSVADLSGEAARTSAGSRTGSPAYMSPEQARGREILPASDLFSLGVVLYQCLTGRLPFDGRTAYEYISNLLSAKHHPLAPLAPNAPFQLVQLIERCLEKEPAWRPESAEAVSLELRSLLEGIARGAAASSVARWSSRRARLSTAAALVSVPLVAIGIVMKDRFWPGNGELEAPRESVPLVTWASEEQDSKVSPDGSWISFISDRNGAPRLFVQPLAGGEAREIATSGDVLAHVWSPDGQRLACYVATPSGLFLQVVPAFFGGAVQTSIPIAGNTGSTARLIRWIGDDVYLVADSRSGTEGRLLSRIAIQRGTVTDITPRKMEEGLLLQWFDVHPATRMLAVAAVRNQHEDLWIADADGTRARQITEDAYFDRYPVWTGTILTFQSNRGGQIDLWQIDPTSRQTRLVSSSETDEQPHSASLDGSLLTFHLHEANARLWRLKPSGGGATPITNDALSDFAPSAANDGRTVVFQRHAGSPALGATLFDSQLVALSTNPAGADSVAASVKAGFQPEVSPGGSEVAYFGRRTSGSPFASLFVKDLATGQIRTISNQCPLPSFSMTPAEWVHQNLAWSSDRLLYFIEEGQQGDSSQGSLIRRFDPRDGRTAYVTGLLRSRVRDVYPSPDGRELAYVLYYDRTYEVRRRNLASGDERVVYSWNRDDPSAIALYLRGWTNGKLVIVRRLRLKSDAEIMDIVVTTADGSRSVAHIDGALGISARLSPDGRTLYYTRAAGGAMNIHALHLERGTTRRLTANQLPSTTFSGIEPLADGSIIYSQNERRQDIWLSRVSTVRSTQNE